MHTSVGTVHKAVRSRSVLLILALLAPAAPSAATAPAATSPAQPVATTIPAHLPPSRDLEASWEAPWNPDHALSRRSTWEQVVLLPGRIVSLPLVGLGWATDYALGAVEQRSPSLIAPTTHRTAQPRLLTPRLSHLGDRTGLGAAIVAQAGSQRLGRASLEYAASNKFYNRTRATWKRGPASLQYGYEWRPQDRYYGAGTASSKDSVSSYAMQREFVLAGARWAWGRDSASARPRGAFNVWAGPRSAVTRNGRESGVLSYERRFPGDAAEVLDTRVEHFIYGVSAMADHRAGAPHWNHGWRVLASAEQFAPPVGTLALHSAADDGATFSRYDIEAESGISMFRDPRTLRLAVHLTDQQVTSGRGHFLVSDMATLGDRAGLGGFVAGRFHDLDLLLTRLTYVFPLVHRFEMDAHSEWGAVYPDLWNDASLRSLHHSLGLSLRSRTDRVPRGAVGFDWSGESMRISYTLGAAE